MRVLLMDTCGASGSVALAEGDAVVATELLPGRSSSERLVPVVRQMLEAQGWELRELGAIGVVRGPGSFTGMRVGLSAAKGLSEAGEVALVAVSRLAVLVRVGGLGLAVLDAGRGEVYFGEYVGGRRVREALLTGDEVRAAVGDGVVVACEEKVLEALQGLQVKKVAEPVAEDLLGIVLERVAAGAVDDAEFLDAHYMRQTEMEILARLKLRGGVA